MSNFFRYLFLGLLSFALIVVAPQVALGQISGSPPLPPQAFQRSMIFVDGTNLFYRFEDMKLGVSSFYDLFTRIVGGRLRPNIMRICWYTIEEKYQRTLKIHGENCLDKIRVVLGTGVPSGGSEPKEKGVDALLVADLIYHAAMKNCDYAQLVSIDLDFAYAIKRVEDFGCRSAVVAVGYDAPLKLQQSCDDYVMVTKENLLRCSPIVKARI
jgi:uncharacterized LabA/DUF88 family protein